VVPIELSKDTIAVRLNEYSTYMGCAASRGLQRDVVYLGWPIAPSYMRPAAGEGERLGTNFLVAWGTSKQTPLFVPKSWNRFLAIWRAKALEIDLKNISEWYQCRPLFSGLQFLYTGSCKLLDLFRFETRWFIDVIKNVMTCVTCYTDKNIKYTHRFSVIHAV
jgi:hypothetical protein